MLDPLTGVSSQSQPVSILDRLTGAGSDLERNQKAFLIACQVSELAPAIITDYRYKLSRFIVHCQTIGLTETAKVTRDDIRLFILKLQESNKTYSISDYLKTVKRFFSWLVEEGVLEYSPADKIKPPKVPEVLIKPFEVDHIQALLNQCDDSFIGLRNRTMILIFLDSGVRLREMVAIKIADIDFDNQWIKVMGKGGKERVVGVCRRTQKALLQYLMRRHDDYPELWVTEKRRPMKYEGVRVVFTRMKIRSGITEVRISPHTFRHTNATMLLSNGASVFQVQSLLGHAKQDMTRRYTKFLDSKKAVEQHAKFSPVDKLKL